MEDLPPPLILDILSRLHDAFDLARCRLTSKTLNSLSYEVKFVNLFCSYDRYLKSRSEETKYSITPFKTIFSNLISNMKSVESVCIGVEKELVGLSYDDLDDESDDLYLTDVAFVEEWLPRVCGGLRSLAVLDFWMQSCWRKSEILALISSHCHHLLDLEIKNAWLSMDGLKPMPALTTLTLEFIRLEDEDLKNVNNCFPSLQVLNLIGVGGLKEPRISLLQLKICHWSVSNAPLSLAVYAPNLIDLKLKCVKPKSLVLETPLLSDFHLEIDNTGNFKVVELPELKNLRIESPNLCGLLEMFPNVRTVKHVMLDTMKHGEEDDMLKFSFEALADFFPKVKSIRLGPEAWSEMETCFRVGCYRRAIEMRTVKEIVAHLVLCDSEVTVAFISFLLEKCTNLSDMALLINRGVDSKVASNFISRCTALSSRVRWRWGMWKEGTKDCWISDGI
ncbi:hypothetical protein RJ641_026793 [Dillenia turbinata]|uniref:F-box domain-containing protein n=1 Tax=Dillenia turbinata TaxID=194707 RepID=A0AAN8ZKP9_9MAGN